MSDPILPPKAAAGAHGWTDERVELLKKLHADGLSCSQIARALGGATRNSIIGKLSRLGIKSGRIRTAATNKLNGREARLPKPKRPKLIIVGCGGVVEKPPGQLPRYAVPEDKFAALPGCEPVPPLDIRAFGQCRWPIGDPQSPDFGFCGCATESTYCETHAAIAYQPQTEKKKTANEMARALRRYL